jgi:hypothetical protein
MDRDKMRSFIKKSKITLAGIVFLSLSGFFIYTGYAARPMVDDVILPFFTPEKMTYTATKTPHDLAVEADMQSEEAKAYCKDYSEHRVSMRESREANSKALKAYQNAVAAELRNSAREEDSLASPGIMEAGMDMNSAVDNFKRPATTSKK